MVQTTSTKEIDKIRILIADDHPLARAGMRSILDAQPDLAVVAEASDGKQAVAQAVELKPRLVLMDIAMPNMNGIEATRVLKQQLPGIVVLVVTMHDDEQFFFPVLRAGASGYFLKEEDPQELVYAIRQVCQGNVFLSPRVVKLFLEDIFLRKPDAADETYYALTSREKEILHLVAAGQTNHQMADALFLSIRTVEKHRQSAMHKLGLATRCDVTKYAIRHGILDLNE